MASASSKAHRVVIDYLSVKGLVDRSEAEYLGRRVKAVFRVYTAFNPLTEQELRFLKEFFSRDVDEATVEEAERAYELGKKLFVEDFDERVFLAAVAAAYIRGYLVSKEVRRRREGKAGEER